MSHRQRKRNRQPEFDLRLKMGIGQELFAQLLGVSRSALAMAESGLRSFPTKTLIRYLQLEREWELQQNPVTRASKPTLKEEPEPRLNLKIRSLDLKQKTLSLKLDLLPQPINIDKTTSFVSSLIEQGNGSELEKQWMKKQLEKHRKEAIRLDKKRAKLSLELSLVEAQLQVYKKYAEQASGINQATK